MQTFEGKRFVMNHFDYLAKPIAKSGDYDVVCFGHNHEIEVARLHELQHLVEAERVEREQDRLGVPGRCEEQRGRRPSWGS